MIISIKCTDGLNKTVYIKIDDNKTVKDLKKMIEEKTNIKEHRMVLKKDNYAMRENLELNLYQILDGQAIQIGYLS